MELKILCHGCELKLDVGEFEPFSFVQCPNCGTELIVPRKFGSFILEECVAQGNITSDYRTLDMTLNREVMVRVLNESIAKFDGTAEKFIEAAKVGSLINDAHVVTVYSCGEADGESFVVTEFVDGGGLDTYLTHTGDHSITINQARGIVEQVAHGLKAVHESGYYYGDMSPSDIVVSGDFEVKLCDVGFGSLRDMIVVQESRWSRFYYISPEKLQHQEIKPASDVYSLGIILYHLLTGIPPFVGENEEELANIRLSIVPVPPKEINPKISESLNQLVMDMLALNASERPQSAEEVLDRLKKVNFTNMTVKRKAMTMNPSASPKVRVAPKKKQSALGGLFLFILLIVFIGSVLIGIDYARGENSFFFKEGDIGYNLLQKFRGGSNEKREAGEGKIVFTNNVDDMDEDLNMKGEGIEKDESLAPPKPKDNRLPRPRPKGLDFANRKEDLLKYLKSIKDRKEVAIEKVRIEELGKCREEMQQLLSHTPFQPSKTITLQVKTSSNTLEKVVGYAVTANRNEVRLKRKKFKPVTIKWSRVPLVQYIDFYDFYIKMRLSFAKNFKITKSSTDEEKQDKVAQEEAAADLGYRLALLCDWYGDNKSSLKYAKLAYRYGPSYRKRLKMMLPHLFKK